MSAWLHPSHRSGGRPLPGIDYVDEEDTATADKDYAVAATGDDVDYSTVDDNTGAAVAVPYVDLGNTQVRPD